MTSSNVNVHSSKTGIMAKGRRSQRRSTESKDVIGLANMEFEIVLATARRDTALDGGCRSGNCTVADGSVKGPCVCLTTPSVEEETRLKAGNEMLREGAALFDRSLTDFIAQLGFLC